MDAFSFFFFFDKQVQSTTMQKHINKWPFRSKSFIHLKLGETQALIVHQMLRLTLNRDSLT